MEILKGPLKFQWDSGNQDKNVVKHRVTNVECEEVFFDPHKRLLGKVSHVSGSGEEDRYILIGHTKEERALYVVFTLRAEKVRVISARDLNQKERRLLP